MISSEIILKLNPTVAKAPKREIKIPSDNSDFELEKMVKTSELHRHSQSLSEFESDAETITSEGDKYGESSELRRLIPHPHIFSSPKWRVLPLLMYPYTS